MKMERIPDHPAIRWMERTGYPPGYRSRSLRDSPQTVAAIRWMERTGYPPGYRSRSLRDSPQTVAAIRSLSQGTGKADATAVTRSLTSH